MIQQGLSALTNGDVLDRYRSAAAADGRYSAKGVYKKANPQAELAISCYRELRSRGTPAEARLLELLEDDDPAVRVWAASHVLEFAPGQAEEALIEREAGTSLAAFTARMTLREWRAGRLAFP